MSFLNRLLRPLVDALLAPFTSFSPLVGLSVVSLVTAVGILLVFKYTSNQKALEDVKRKIHAGLFEIRLYNDDFRAIMKAQLDILRANLTYMRHSLAPMIWTLPPLVLLIAQLQFHYGYAGLPLERTALLKVTLAEGAASGDKPALEVEAPAGVAVDSPSVWVPSLREMTWRITPVEQGDFELSIRNGSESVTKSVRAREEVVRRSPYRVRGFLNELIYPAEPALPAGSFESVTVTYPEVNVDVFGIELHWMIVYFLLSIVFAFILRGPMGVTF